MKFHNLHSYTDIYEVWIILKIIDNDNRYILKNWTNLTYWIIILFMLHLALRNELKGKRRPHTKRKLNDAMRGCEVWSFLLIVLWDCRPQTPCFLTIENIKNICFITNLTKLFQRIKYQVVTTHAYPISWFINCRTLHRVQIPNSVKTMNSTLTISVCIYKPGSNTKVSCSLKLLS